MPETLSLPALGGFWIAAGYSLSYDGEGAVSPDFCLILHGDPVHEEAGYPCWGSAFFSVCSRLRGNATNPTYGDICAWLGPAWHQQGLLWVQNCEQQLQQG